MTRLRALFAFDVRALALFRVGLGVCVLLDLFTRAVDVDAFLTDRGVLPRAAWFRVVDDRDWSFHAATGSTIGVAFLLAIAALCACALVVGFRTRIACVALLILTISIQDRNPAVFYGFDLLLRTCLLWSCFLPLGAAFSVDNPRSTSSHKNAVFSAGTVAFTIQIAAVYLFSAIQKLENDTWRDLSAGFFALTADTHATSFARFVSHSIAATRALSASTLAIELLIPLLLFVPWKRSRTLFVGVFVAFHVATALLFTIGLFPLIGIVALLPFIRFKQDNDVIVDDNRVASSIAGAALAFVIAFNVETVTERFLPRGVRDVGVALHLDQTWNMFVKPMADGWFTAPADVDGRRVDVLFGEHALSWDKPASVSSTFPSMRWRKYITNLVRPPFEKQRVVFLRYLCRTTHAKHVELWFVREIERVDGAAASTSREKLGALDCP